MEGVDRISLDKNLNVCLQKELKPEITLRFKLVKGQNSGEYSYDPKVKETVLDESMQNSS